jgi:glucans biosynthesis protein C
MTTKMEIRLNYIDWLRVLAVMVLFIFHSGEIFTKWTFYVMDTELSPVIHCINSFIYQWHMPLFMFLAGMSSYIALNFRSGRVFLYERVKRLFIPLIFGILVVIPPQAYLRMFGNPDMVWPKGFEFNAPGPGYDKNFFEFYPDYFNGAYPNGNLEWGHLWFLAYLFTFSIIILPLFLYLKSEKGRGIIDFFIRIVEKPPGHISFLPSDCYNRSPSQVEISKFSKPHFRLGKFFHVYHRIFIRVYLYVA